MPRPTRTSRGEQPAGIRCARSVLRPANCLANSARGVDSARIGEGRRTPPPLRSNLPSRLAETYPAAATLEGWYPRKYAYCTIYRK